MERIACPGTTFLGFDRLPTAGHWRSAGLRKQEHCPQQPHIPNILEDPRAHSTFFFHQEKSFQDHWRERRALCG
jgi:hypothetical protein